MRKATLAAVVIAAAAAAASPAQPVLLIEGGPLLPYRVNRAVVSSEAGLRGTVEAVGLRWDGARATLFRAETGATTGSVEAAFYLDEDFRALELRAGTTEGPAELHVDLAETTGLGAVTSAEERELRRAMRDLKPPLAAPPRARFSREAALSLPLEGLDLADAAAKAAARLFAPPVPTAAFAALAVSVLAAAIAAALPRKGAARPRKDGGVPRRDGEARIGGRSLASFGLSLGSAIVLSLAAAVLASRPPALYRASFPTTDPSLALSGLLERSVERREGFSIVEYASRAENSAGAAGTNGKTARLVAVSAPSGGGVPLDEVAPLGALVRFSPPPAISARGGALVLEGTPGTIGWVIDEKR